MLPAWGQEPYSPILDALARYLQLQSPTRLANDLDGCDWLVRLLPELAGVLQLPAGGTLTPDQERRLLFAAVARLLGNVAGPAGSLLVLDDLQWAGVDALDLLAVLARGAGGRLRIVGGYRDTDVMPSDALAVLVGDLAQAGLVQQLSLGPLSGREATALVDDLLVGSVGTDDAVAEHVLQRAGGTPFFLISYAQALSTGSGEIVPWDLAQGIRQRIALLSESGREMVAAAAIAGRQVPRGLLLAVVAGPESEMLAGLEELCRARLLLEDGDRAYVFSHDVIREVVEIDVGAARRAALHRRVAMALETQRSASVELLAYHYGRSDVQERAAPYLEQAGDQAWAQQARGAAERHYRDLLDLLERAEPDADTARASEKLSHVLARTGRFAGSLPLLWEAARVYAAMDDRASLVRVTARIGWVHSSHGSAREGIAIVAPLLESLGEDDPPANHLALHVALSQLFFAAGEYSACLAAAERAAELAGASGDHHTRVLADVQRMNVLQTLGRVEDALGVAEQLFPLDEGTEDPVTLLRAYRDLAYIHMLRGNLTEARSCMERAFPLVEKLGDPAQFAFSHGLRGWLSLLQGDWAASRTDLETGVALSGQIERPVYGPYPRAFLTHLLLAEGDWEAASLVGEEGLALAEQSGDLQAVRWVAAPMAELDVRRGSPAMAIARLTPLLDRPGLEECDVTAMLPVLAWAQLELGRVEHATALIEQALLRIRREGLRLILVEALRVRATIALRAGRWSEATCSLEEGVAAARKMASPYAEARLLQVDGQRLAALGDPATHDRFHAALRIFEQLGANRDAEQTRQSLTSISRAAPPG